MRASLSPGDNHRLRLNELPAVSNQVEPRGGTDVPAVQVHGPGQVHAGALRGAGAAPPGDAQECAGVPAAALGRRRAPSRAVHQPAQWRRLVQVRLHYYLLSFVYGFRSAFLWYTRYAMSLRCKFSGRSVDI